MGIHFAKQSNGKMTVTDTANCAVTVSLKPGVCNVTSTDAKAQQKQPNTDKSCTDNGNKNNNSRSNSNSNNNSDKSNTETNNSDEFTRAEIRRIRDTWSRLIEQANTHGQEVFLAIFALRPELRRFFPFRDVPDESLHTHAAFRGHAMRFMRAIDLVVLHLDDLEVGASPSLVSLGKTHRRIPGFQHEDLWVFHSAMDVVWEKHIDGYDAATRDAWQKVFNVITAKMAEGHCIPNALPQRISPAPAPAPAPAPTPAPAPATSDVSTHGACNGTSSHCASVIPATASG